MGPPFRFGFFPTDHSGNFYQTPKLHFTIRATSIAFYHSGKLDETGGRKTRLRQLARELCMKRPARHRSSPMELAESGSIHWRSSIATHSPSTASGVASVLRASKSRQKPLICVQWISMAVAPGERTTAGLGCSTGCGPTVRVAAPEVADPAHPQRGMPRVRHRRGVFFRPSA